MQLALRTARSAARSIVDYALPPRCPGCGTVTADDHRFCIACWQSLQFLGEPCCARCGMPFPFDAGAGSECAGCIADPPRFDRMRAAVAYGEIARKVALKLKYSGRPGVARTIARFMERHVDAEADSILIPVPLHRWRIWRRGYNQSALIASELAVRTGLRTEFEVIERIKRTPPLRGLGRRERALTVRGAFRVPKPLRNRIVGRSILLVDDVFTTGATADACAAALKRAGAARVEIICWARVVGKESH